LDIFDDPVSIVPLTPFAGQEFMGNVAIQQQFARFKAEQSRQGMPGSLRVMIAQVVMLRCPSLYALAQETVSRMNNIQQLDALLHMIMATSDEETLCMVLTA